MQQQRQRAFGRRKGRPSVGPSALLQYIRHGMCTKNGEVKGRGGGIVVSPSLSFYFVDALFSENSPSCFPCKLAASSRDV